MNDQTAARSEYLYTEVAHMLFDWTWEELAAKNICDGLHGKEYCRVSLAWRKAGRPILMESFILAHAIARASNTPAKRT